MKLGLSVFAAVAKSMRRLRDKSNVAETLSMTFPVSNQGKYTFLYYNAPRLIPGAGLVV